MPGFLLHLGATVMCAHAGQATPVTPNPRVPMTSLYAVAGCTVPPPAAANGPCVTAQYITAATRITSNGLPLLLIDSQAICVPSGTPLLATVTQTRVTGV